MHTILIFSLVVAHPLRLALPAHPAPPTLLQQEKTAAGLGPGGLQENAEPSPGAQLRAS